MTRFGRWARCGVLTLATATAAACAAPIRVNSYAERTADVSRYGTYDFAPVAEVATGDPRLDSNPFFNERVRSAVDKALRAKGYTRDASGAPDVTVHFHASVTQEILDVSAADRRAGYCGEHDCRPFVYDAGTLLMDLVDTGTGKLAWRGWAETAFDGAVDDQAWMDKRIDAAVARIVAQLPRSAVRN